MHVESYSFTHQGSGSFPGGRRTHLSMVQMSPTLNRGKDIMIRLRLSGFLDVNIKGHCKSSKLDRHIILRTRDYFSFRFRDFREIPESDDESKVYHLSRIPRLFPNYSRRFTGYIRRRRGRGGRVIFDRLAPPTETGDIFPQVNSRPPSPEFHKTILPKHDLVDTYIPCRDNSMASTLKTQDDAATRSEVLHFRDALTHRLHLSFLRNQSNRQLACCLSRLTGGRHVGRSWLGSSGNSIYPSLSPVNNVGPEPSSVLCPIPGTTPSLVPKHVPTPTPLKPHITAKNQILLRSHEATHSLRRGDNSALAVSNGLFTQPDGPAAGILAATVSIISVNVLMCLLRSMLITAAVYVPASSANNCSSESIAMSMNYYCLEHAKCACLPRIWWNT